MTTKYFSVAGAFVFLLSCNSFKQEISPFSGNTENVITTVMNGDSIEKPYRVKAPHLPAVPAGSPKRVRSKNNIIIAGRPEKISLLNPGQVIPGTSGCPLPLKTIAIEKKNRALVPDVVVAENATTNDMYPLKFTLFGKLQGLASNDIYTIYEDRSSNLWIGTIGSGVNKYDGRKFTHFTEFEGLGENYVRFILEDTADNMWFGTLSNGISRYD